MSSHTLEQVALITGSSSGFGMLAAVELAHKGFRVVATMRNLAKAERLEQALAEAGVRADIVQLDVTDQASIDAAMVDVRGRIGEIDVLVNNAGFGLAGFVEDLTLDEIREQFETNFFGLVAVTKAVITSMRERRRGRIINVSSVAGRVANPAFAAYAGSKFAVEGFSESLRHELLPHQVFVSLIEPGVFRTDIFDANRRVAAEAFNEASPNYEDVKRMEAIVDARVAKSTADPRDVARVIARAATAKHPRLRYLVGKDANVSARLKSVVPSRIWEGALGRYLGLGTNRTND